MLTCLDKFATLCVNCIHLGQVIIILCWFISDFSNFHRKLLQRKWERVKKSDFNSQRILHALQCYHLFSKSTDVDQHSGEIRTFTDDTQVC